LRRILITFLAGSLLLVFLSAAPGPVVTPIAVDIDKAGVALKGRFYAAAGEGPIRTVILLPGFPGGEGDVLGIGSELAEAGFNAMTFNFAGSYQSQGESSWPNAQSDIQAAFDFARRPENAAKYGIDTARIVLGGWCFGGGMALGYTAGHPEVKAVFSIAGNDHGEFLREYARNPQFQKLVDDMVASWTIPPLGTRLAMGSRPGEIVAAGLDKLDPIFDLRASAPRLADREILVVGGWNDRQVTIDQYILPFYRALEKAGAKRVTIRVFQDGHDFKGNREPLARTIVDWLKSIQAFQ